jgi:hypothetical protein
MILTDLPCDILNKIHSIGEHMKMKDLIAYYFWEWKQTVVYTYKGKYYIRFEDFYEQRIIN